jgi:hypothetical protein
VSMSAREQGTGHNARRTYVTPRQLVSETAEVYGETIWVLWPQLAY